MRRWIVVALLFVLAAQTFEAQAGPKKRAARRVAHRRAVVAVNHGWPLRRPLRRVYVRPARVPIRMGPRVFLAPVVFTGVVIAAASAPARDILVWEDGETLQGEDDWTEFTLNCDNRGTKLWIEVAGGRVQVDWAEVVFENGETRVIDFNDRTIGPGLYPLLDFRDGRKVDHVRMVAKAKADQARIVLKMEK